MAYNLYKEEFDQEYMDAIDCTIMHDIALRAFIGGDAKAAAATGLAAVQGGIGQRTRAQVG